jgi:hypothetical protein
MHFHGNLTGMVDRGPVAEVVREWGATLRFVASTRCLVIGSGLRQICP